MHLNVVWNNVGQSNVAVNLSNTYKFGEKKYKEKKKEAHQNLLKL